jgi:hypothetical protein
MVVYEAYDPDTEVKGSTVNSLVSAASAVSSVFEKRINDTLAENGIEDVREEEWYSLQACLDTLAEISESIGPQTLASIGKAIPDHADWPPGIDSVSGGLASVGDAYQMNHRKGEIGFYEYEAVGDDEALITCRNPYPCEFDEGLITGVAEKFGEGAAYVDVAEESDTCRSEGGEACVYRVSW